MEEDNFPKGIRLEDYISKAQTAEIFQKTTRTIQNWIDDDKFPGALKVAGQWFIPKSDISLSLEVHEVIPMKHEMTKEELVSALEAMVEKRDTELASNMALIVKEVQVENIKVIEEIRLENQEIKKKLEKENSQLKKQIEESHQLITEIAKEQKKIRRDKESHDAELMERIRSIQSSIQDNREKASWWKKLFGKH